MQKQGEMRNISELPRDLLASLIADFLTEKQAKYAKEYYFNRHCIREIGYMFGVDKSTVSRTLKRAKNKLETVLRYTLAK